MALIVDQAMWIQLHGWGNHLSHSFYIWHISSWHLLTSKKMWKDLTIASAVKVYETEETIIRQQEVIHTPTELTNTLAIKIARGKKYKKLQIFQKRPCNMIIPSKRENNKKCGSGCQNEYGSHKQPLTSQNIQKTEKCHWGVTLVHLFTFRDTMIEQAGIHLHTIKTDNLIVIGL